MFSVRVHNREGGSAQTYTFEAMTEINLGRDEDNDIVLAHAEVSNHHARIVENRGQYIVVDLETSNGTYVNGARLHAPFTSLVKDSDHIQIASFNIQITTQHEPEFVLPEGYTALPLTQPEQRNYSAVVPALCEAAYEPLVIELFPCSGAEDDAHFERVHSTLQSVKRLGHPHVEDLRAVERTRSGSVALITAHVSQNRPLATLLDSALTVQKALDVLLEITETIDEMHVLGLVHGRLNLQTIELISKLTTPDNSVVLWSQACAMRPNAELEAENRGPAPEPDSDVVALTEILAALLTRATQNKTEDAGIGDQLLAKLDALNKDQSTIAGTSQLLAVLREVEGAWTPAAGEEQPSTWWLLDSEMKEGRSLQSGEFLLRPDMISIRPDPYPFVTSNPKGSRYGLMDYNPNAGILSRVFSVALSIVRIAILLAVLGGIGYGGYLLFMWIF